METNVLKRDVYVIPRTKEMTPGNEYKISSKKNRDEVIVKIMDLDDKILTKEIIDLSKDGDDRDLRSMEFKEVKFLFNPEEELGLIRKGKMTVTKKLVIL